MLKIGEKVKYLDYYICRVAEISQDLQGEYRYRIEINNKRIGIGRGYWIYIKDLKRI